MPPYEIYQIRNNPNDNRYRYAVGTTGGNTLYFIGITPSTGTIDAPDATIDRVERKARMEGYDSYVIFNVYPQRNNIPLPERVDEEQHNLNVECILNLIKDDSVIWAAWGVLNGKDWLRVCKNEILAEIRKNRKNIQWKATEINEDGSPRFPYLNDAINNPFLDYDPYSYNGPKENVKKKQLTITKISINKNSSSMPLTTESYGMIVQNVKKLVNQINEYGKKGKNKKPIFKESGLLRLLMNIENLCASRESFESFASSLYQLFREKTRDKNPNYKSKNDHYYTYRFPDDFWKKDNLTKRCMDSVCIIRNEFQHTEDHEDEGQKYEKEKEYIDVIEELTDRRLIPDSIEDYQNLQIGELKLFENALQDLLQMVKEEL